MASFLSDEPYQHRTCDFPKRSFGAKKMSEVFSSEILTNGSGFTTMNADSVFCHVCAKVEEERILKSTSKDLAFKERVH